MVGWGNKRAGYCRLDDGINQQAGLSAGANFEILGPSPDRSRSPAVQRDGSGLKKASKIKQSSVHKTAVGTDRLGEFIGPDSTWAKAGWPSKMPKGIKVG